MLEELLHTLQMSQKEENAGETILRLLNDAVEGNGVHTLEDIRAGIEATSLSREIDVITAVPLLLTCSRQGAVEMLNLIGSNCSAKETVLTFQVTLGHLAVSLSSEGGDGNGDDGGDDEQDQVVVSELILIMNIYSLVLPRLPKRRKPPSETLRPLIDQLISVIRLAGPRSSVQSGSEVVISASRVTKSLATWAAEDIDEQQECASILFDFMCFTLEACSRSIHIGVAQSAFERLFPRFVSRAPPLSAPLPEDVVQLALTSLSLLGFTTPDLWNRPSIGSVVLLAHAQPPHPLGSELFPLLPYFLMSIQTNTALDESLALLLISLRNIKTTGTPDVPPEFIIPLCHVLGPLTGSHPDASTRHMMFRLLSITLSLAGPQNRFTLLRELLSDSEGLTPQMQVAAIGLVREAVTEALSASQREQPNPFASPTLLRDIGPLIFGLQSAELFVKCDVPLADFMETSEPLRLVESLTLLYFLLRRDTDNETGIRRFEQIQAINQRFLLPLRSQIDFWMRGDESDKRHDEDVDHEHSILQLGIIDMWLERTQSVAREIL